MTGVKISYVRFCDQLWKKTELPWTKGYRPTATYTPVQETDQQRNQD